MSQFRYFLIIADHEQQKFIYNVEKPCICHVCAEPFSEENLLENHVKIHPDAENFLCGRNFTNFIEQRKLSFGHRMPVHDDDTDSFKLDWCGQLLNNRRHGLHLGHRLECVDGCRHNGSLRFLIFQSSVKKIYFLIFKAA